MPQYSTGHIIVTKDSDLIKGIDTKFVENVKAGDLLYVRYSESKILGPFVIDRVLEDRVLYITEQYGGDSEFRVNFAITNSFTENYGIPRVSIGDIAIAKSITETMFAIEDLLQGSNAGFDGDFLYSMDFEFNEYNVGTGDDIAINLVGIPGNISYSDSLFDNVVFELINNSEPYVSMNYYSRGRISLKALNTVLSYNELKVRATIPGRPDLVAECFVKIFFNGLSSQLQSFSLKPCYEVAPNKSVIIKPKMTPSNASDDRFSIYNTGSWFYSYFDTIVSFGKQIEISAASSSANNSSTVTISHYKENGSLDIPNQQVSLMSTFAADKIASMSFSSPEIEIDIFGKNEFSIIFSPLASQNPSWAADFRTIIEYVTKSGWNAEHNIDYSAILNVSAYIDPHTKNRIIVKTEPNYTTDQIRQLSQYDFFCYVYIKIVNIRSGLYSILKIKCKHKASGTVFQEASKYSIKNGECLKLKPVLENTSTTDKFYMLTVSDVSKIQPLNYKSQEEGYFVYDKDVDIILKGISEGVCPVFISTWFRYCNPSYTDITITPSGALEFPITGFSVKHNLRNVAVSDTDAAANVGYNTDYFITFSPSNATSKAVKVSTNTPDRIKLKQEYYICDDDSNRIDLSFYSRQQGAGHLKIETVDGSNLSFEVNFTIAGTSAPVNMISFGPDAANTVDYLTNEQISSYISSELGEKKDKIVFTNTSGKIIKVPILYNPSDATLKSLRFYTVNKSYGVFIHPADITNTYYKSLSDQYLLIDCTNKESGTVKVVMTGVNNDLEEFFFIE